MKWEIEIDMQVQALKSEQERPQGASIYETPSAISNQNQEAYMPQMVSFGPYHHGKKSLSAMEKHKERALLHFLRRSGVSLQDICYSLRDEAQKLKDTYESLDESWHNDTERFLQLMVVDGCFMLEILNFANEPVYDYPPDDPVFSTHGKVYVLPFIRRDMLLLENQLPMPVLIKLLDATTELKSEEGVVTVLNDLIRRFCLPNYHFHLPRHLGECLHILDLHRKILLQTYFPEHSLRCSERVGQCIWNGIKCLLRHSFLDSFVSRHSAIEPHACHSATELHEAGICFKSSHTRFLDDISFKDGILELPTFVVNDMTKSTFLNLIAFERCHVSAGHDITAFICFMDNIVKDERDISLLRSVEILHNCIGSDKTAAKLFNTMAKDLKAFPSGKLNDVKLEVARHCELPWNKRRAYVVSTYFRNPWAIITLVPGILLFVLTVVQAAYSILQYEQGKRSH